MSRLTYLILIFAILFAIFMILPALLGGQFTPYPLMKNGDVLDLLTPVVIVPLYWLLFQIRPHRSPNQKETLVFLILTALWVEGHGMHLVANSIGHLTLDNPNSEIKQLTFFYDEILSHYIWHLGLIGMSVLLIYRQWQNPFTKQYSSLKIEITAGIIHGLTYFICVIESATTISGVPFALGVVMFTLIWGRRNLQQRLSQQPILTFFFISYALACLLFLGWGLYWGGLPEFSQVGIID